MDEPSLFDLPSDIFLYIFRISTYENSTRYMLRMTCKHFHSLFAMLNGNYSRLFLQEDNILWYRNSVWNFDDILLYGGIECFRKFVFEHNPSSSLLNQIYRISATKGYLEILILLDDHYSEQIKPSYLNRSGKKIRDDRYEYIFMENALPNLQFFCCDYLFMKSGGRFYCHGCAELPDDLPIDAWHYLIRKELVKIEEAKEYMKEKKYRLLLEMVGNK